MITLHTPMFGQPYSELKSRLERERDSRARASVLALTHFDGPASDIGEAIARSHARRSHMAMRALEAISRRLYRWSVEADAEAKR